MKTVKVLSGEKNKTNFDIIMEERCTPLEQSNTQEVNLNSLGGEIKGDF